MSKEAMRQALEWFQWFIGETDEKQTTAPQVKKALEEALAERQGEAVAWHNPVATAVRDGMTGQVQLEYIGHFPADELVRLYAAPQPHHIDLVNVAVAVRDACHRAWVTSAENWRADVDVRQIVRDTHPAPAQQPLSQWIKTADQMPPEDVRVFWLDYPSNRVGFDTYMGEPYSWAASHWMHIPPVLGIGGEKP